MPVALPLLELPILAAVILAIALTLLVVVIVRGLFHPLRTLPVVGGAIGGLLDTIVHYLMSLLGIAISGSEQILGASFHALARMTDWLWREFKAHAVAIAALATPLGLLLEGISGIRSLIRHFAHTATTSTAQVKVLERELHGIDRQVRTLERDFSKGIGHDVLPRLKSLDRELHRVEHQTLPAIRSDVSTADSAISNLYEWAKGKASLLGVGTFAFAVAEALSLVGNGWLGCKENPFSRSSNPCGLWSVLGRVLGLAAFLTIAFDFQEFVAASEEVATFIGSAVSEFEGTFALSLAPLPPPQ